MTAVWTDVAVQGAWQSLLVSAVVLTIIRLGRRWPSGVREGLVVVALLKFLVPPFMVLPTGIIGPLSGLVAAGGGSVAGDRSRVVL